MRQHPEQLDPILQPMARRVNLAVWLNHALGPVIALLSAWATTLLVLKLVSPDLAGFSFAIPAMAPLALIYSYVYCRRHGLFFEPADLAEVVDHLYRDDGSIASVYERPDLVRNEAFYRNVAREVAPRRPKLRAGYYARRMAPVLVYVVICLLVPPRQSAAAAQNRAIVDAMTQPLEARLAEFSPILPEEKLEELKEQLAQIQQEEAEVSRERWETVEELERRIEEAVETSQFDLAPIVTSLQTMAQANSSLQSSGPGGDQQMQQLAEQLSASLNDPNKKLSTQLRGDLSKLAGQLKGGAIDRKELDRQLAELRKKLGNCQGGNCNGTCPGGMCSGTGPGKEGPGNNPGKGGINRGRGDAPLVFGEENLLENSKFNQEELFNQFLASEDMVDLGITPLAPRTDPGAISAGASRGYEDQRGAPVSRSRISPSQRRVVEKYFSETNP